MSRRTLTPEQKAKEDAARKGIASLRRASGNTLALSMDERTARAKRAVLDYMRGKGLFAPYADLDGKVQYVVQTCRLDWNPEAPPRARSVRIERHVPGHWREDREPKFKNSKQWARRQRRDWIDSHWETVAEVDVPHWDYDGVDPLVAREPWERKDCDCFDSDWWRKPWNRHEPYENYEIEADEADSAEQMNEYHEEIEGAATFAPKFSRDWA